ncbi:transglycosylase SLT domain-containing protein [Thioclava sp. GXIMD4215]|uniref:transglycosylase SLT domain-containing protein n=1 Tax=Thioclava sp. GXIMD4215 TaxID=3131928 RepID=UPI003872AD4C
MHLSRRSMFLGLFALSACGATPKAPQQQMNLRPNETPQLRKMINQYADHYEIPRTLMHRVITRESGYRPDARNGSYYGLMQISPQTAGAMGFRGKPSGLLDPETNLKYAGKYLRGAWMCADGSSDKAVYWYSRGYYYEAKRRGILTETGLRG